MKPMNNKQLEKFGELFTQTASEISDDESKGLLARTTIGSKTIGLSKMRNLMAHGGMQVLVDTHNKMVQEYSALPWYKKFEPIDWIITGFVGGYIIGEIIKLF